MFGNIKLSGTITKYSTKELNNYSLRDQRNFIILESPKIGITQDKKNEDIQCFNQKFNECIDNFIFFIQNNKSNINLELFLKNLSTLTIEEKNFNKFIFIKSNIKGEYYGNINKIVLNKNNSLVSIYHELLHCSSRKKINNNLLIGFAQLTAKSKIGIGLNEGFTSLLEERYFSSLYKNKNYLIEKLFADALEKIIEKEKMEHLYFEADLYNLIKELQKYAEDEKIILFLKYFDDLFLFTKNEKKYKISIDKIHFISCFLLECYIKKLHFLNKENLITKNESKNKFNEFIENLCVIYKTKYNIFEILPVNEAEKVLDNFFNKNTEENKKNNLL